MKDIFLFFFVVISLFLIFLIIIKPTKYSITGSYIDSSNFFRKSSLSFSNDITTRLIVIFSVLFFLFSLVLCSINNFDYKKKIYEIEMAEQKNINKLENSSIPFKKTDF